LPDIYAKNVGFGARGYETGLRRGGSSENVVDGSIVLILLILFWVENDFLNLLRVVGRRGAVGRVVR